MQIVDTALAKREAEGRPIRVAMVGAGFMAKGIALQMAGQIPGLRLVAIANRTLENARIAYAEAGLGEAAVCESAPALQAAIEAGKPAITQDPMLVASCPHVDVLVECTGTLEETLPVVFKAMEHGIHLVMMNAELDGTLGCLLKVKADKAGVVYTNTDGDQPGVIMNLYRFVRGLGIRPVLCGNIKGLQDPYRTPETQKAFAAKWKQNPVMVTSFADGTKISFEQALVANATGMTVGKRGMYGHTVEAGTPINDCIKLYDQDELISGPGIVDYVVGAAPAPGVFVFGHMENPLQKHYLAYYKMGEGPLYSFYTPYHLCHFEVPMTIARAALFGDAACAPIGAPTVDVVAVAKKDLQPGEEIDQLGGFTVYGECEKAEITKRDRLLPIGIAIGTKVIRPVAKDAVLTYDDVELPAGRQVDALRDEQDKMFG